MRERDAPARKRGEPPTLSSYANMTQHPTVLARFAAKAERTASGASPCVCVLGTILARAPVCVALSPLSLSLERDRQTPGLFVGTAGRRER
jgi:hypothetical protein